VDGEMDAISLHMVSDSQCPVHYLTSQGLTSSLLSNPSLEPYPVSPYSFH